MNDLILAGVDASKGKMHTYKQTNKQTYCKDCTTILGKSGGLACQHLNILDVTANMQMQKARFANMHNYGLVHTAAPSWLWQQLLKRPATGTHKKLIKQCGTDFQVYFEAVLGSSLLTLHFFF